MEYLDIIDSPQKRLCRDAQGRLYRMNGMDWEEYPFNSIYEGYFPACRFTALGYLEQRYYAAGTDEGGNARVFESDGGEVWIERPLVEIDPMGGRTALPGDVIKLLYMDKPFHLILLSDAGEMAIVPDCPKCVKILPLEGHPTDGCMEDGWIHIRWSSGVWGKLPLSAAQQVRVSWELAQRWLLHDQAQVVDLCPQTALQTEFFDHRIQMEMQEIPEWLEGISTERCILFLCQYGTQADQCAKMARRMGFVRAYSLGGTEEFAHK